MHIDLDDDGRRGRVTVHGDMRAFRHALANQPEQFGHVTERDGLGKLATANERGCGVSIDPLISLHTHAACAGVSGCPIGPRLFVRASPRYESITGTVSHHADRYIATAAPSSCAGKCSPRGNTSTCTSIFTASLLVHRRILFISETTRPTVA